MPIDAGMLSAPVLAPSGDQQFERFAKLARLALDVPTAHVTLAGRELPPSPCANVLENGERLVLDAAPAFAGTPILSSEGNVLGAFCVADVGARNWTAAELELLDTLAAAVSARLEILDSAARNGRLAEDKKAILESSLDCIIVMDHEGYVREWNPAAERTFGWTPEEAVGQRLGDLIVPAELRCRHEEGLRRAATTGATRILGERLRLPALRRDGSSFTAELAITKVDREGHALFTGTIRDVTEVVRGEEELRAAEHRYRSLVENIPLVTYTNSIDEPFRCLYMSPQVESLLGYSPAEWAERPELAVEGIHPDDRERVSALAHQARRDGTPTRCEFRFVARDGRTVWVLDHTIPVRDAEGATVAHQGFLLDVTERKELEEQLRQGQKMEAIGQLAGGIAHDFNNMLTAIGGYTELLASSFAEGDPRADDVEQIRKASDHAAALTRQLLAFSRKQVLLPQRLDVNHAVRELEQMLLRTIGAGISVETALDAEVSPVDVDPDQLARVVLNVALNARDAMPDGGTLRIATAAVERDEQPFVAVELTDTGVGMDDETRLRIFEPFFTTKQQGKGTGLGLATAYGVVDQSGGTIEVESVPGAGSTFRILLPAA